jgi:hypothetical protein
MNNSNTVLIDLEIFLTFGRGSYFASYFEKLVEAKYLFLGKFLS